MMSSVEKLVQELEGIPNFFPHFKERWSLVANELSVPINKISKIVISLQGNLITVREALVKILEDWIQRNDEDKEGIILRDEVINALLSSGLADFAELLQPETPEKKALRNPLIIQGIFKKLPFQDRKSFRTVRKIWNVSTLQIWRDSTMLRIMHELTEPGTHLTYPKFYKLFDKSSGDGDNSGWTQETLKLLEQPYRRVNPTGLILPLDEDEKPEGKFFWEFYAAQIHHLKLNCEFKKYGVCRAYSDILLNTCPNLSEASIVGWESDDEEDDPAKITVYKGKAAWNLQKLKFSVNFLNVEDYDFTKFLDITPNLKSLTVGAHATCSLAGLPLPTVTGEYIKLEKLVVYPALRELTDCYGHLERYTELFPESLKDLSIQTFLNEDDATHRAPDSVVNSIAQCRQLQILRLEYLMDHRDPFYRYWDQTLLEIELPNLTRLDLQYHYNPNETDIYFDFGALRNFPKLKSLYINIPYSAKPEKLGLENERLPGLEAWLYEPPEDEIDKENFPPIRLEQLKTFTYDGWRLGKEDLEYFGDWFPNVTVLKTGLDKESFGKVFKTFLKLETLVLNCQSVVGMEEIVKAKEENEKVRIKLQTKQCGELEIFKGNGKDNQFAFVDRFAELPKRKRWVDQD